MVLLGEPLEARAQVHLVSDHCVIEALFTADVPDNHFSGVDADSNRQGFHARSLPFLIEALQFGAHLEGRTHGTERVIRITDRGTPKSHHGVADEFVEGALVSKHSIGHPSEVLVQYLNQAFGGQNLRKGGETTNVRKQDGKLFFTSDFGVRVLSGTDQLVGQGRRQVLSQGFLQALLLAPFDKDQVSERIDTSHEPNEQGQGELKVEALLLKEPHSRTRIQKSESHRNAKAESEGQPREQDSVHG